MFWKMSGLFPPQRRRLRCVLFVLVGALTMLAPTGPVFPRPAQAQTTKAQAAAQFERGLDLSIAQNWKEAEAAFREAVRLDPGNPKYRTYLKDTLAAQGKFEEKGKPAKKGTEPPAPPPKGTVKPPVVKPTTLPKMPDLPFGLPNDANSQSATRTGDGPAKSHLSDASVKSPAADAAFEKAERLYEAEKWEQAETAYRAALRLKPDFNEGWNALGQACLYQSKWKEAEQAYREATRLTPEESYFHAQLASALLKQGRREDARKEAREAIRLGLGDHEVFDELGLTPKPAGR